MASNHATLDPFTGGGFNDDSTDYLGITSSSDQWVHIAMVWDGTNVLVYVNGQLKITAPGTGGITALATAPVDPDDRLQSRRTAHCFNGLFDEFRVWNVARTGVGDPEQLQQAAQGQRDRPRRLLEVRRDERHHHRGRRERGGHTAHNGTLKADTTAHNPTFVTPPVRAAPRL